MSATPGDEREPPESSTPKGGPTKGSRAGGGAPPGREPGARASDGWSGASPLRLGATPVAVLFAIAGPFAIGWLLSPFRSTFAPQDAALVLVVVLVALATTGRRVVGLLAASSASIAFDFFFTQPYDHLAIAGRADIETTVLLGVVGIVVTEIALRGRRNLAFAEEESLHLAMLHDLAEMAASGEATEFLLIRCAAELSALLHLRDCRFEKSPPDAHLARLVPGGQILLGGRRFDAGRNGLPGREIELWVEGRNAYLGRFVLVPEPGRPVNLERRVVAASVAAQLGAALAAGDHTGGGEAPPAG
jgi:Domain of unknown function (DUF4118)